MGTRLKANEKITYIENTQFVLDRKYCDLKLIGKGSYGVVCKAKDSSRNSMPVAIKKITPMAKTVLDAKHVLREVRIMRHMGKHENIITIEDITVREANDELYIVMELFDSDLHQVIQSSQVLTDQHHRHFMHQLLCGVKYLHDNRIIHRDLKPGNLLVSRNCALRITDFGLARERPQGRVIGDDPSESIDEPMTEHVITRWYRPPELMLCPDGMYTYAVDIWSCGCIFGEMLKRKAMFPGKNFIDQLSRIFDVIGSPNALEVSHIENQEALKFLESQKTKKKVSLHKMFSGVPTPAVALIENMLRFDPSNRSVINEILLSPYFTNVPRTSKSMVFPPTDPDFNFEFERQSLTKYQLRQLIVAEQGFLRRTQDNAIAAIAKEKVRNEDELSVEETATLASRHKEIRNVPVDEHLPKANFAAPRRRDVIPEEPGQRRGSRNAAKLREEGSDVLKPRNRSNSNSRGADQSKDVSRRQPDRDEPERKRSGSGLLQRPFDRASATATNRKQVSTVKAPLVVDGHVLEDDDEADAIIEADYERAKNYLESRRNDSELPKAASNKHNDLPIHSNLTGNKAAKNALAKERADAELERTKKFKEYQEYQRQLQEKYQNKSAISNEKQTKSKGNGDPYEKLSGVRNNDFEVEFAAESVLTFTNNNSSHLKPVTYRNESKDCSDSGDSDEDSVEMGRLKVVPAPVPYPTVPSAGKAVSVVPPSPSRMHKHAMSLLDDERTANKALANMVSPAAPDSPSKSTSGHHAQPHRKPLESTQTISGFGETTGAKGRQQPAPAMSGFGETTGAKGRQPPISIVPAPSAIVPVPPPEAATTKKTPPRRKSPDYSASDNGDFSGTRKGIANSTRNSHLNPDADISVIEHEASVMSIFGDSRPPIERRIYKQPVKPMDGERDKPVAYQRVMAMEAPAVPPAVKEKTEEELEVERLEARLKARRLTVPKSPKFSKMSWQRGEKKSEAQGETSSNNYNRAASAPRRNTMNTETRPAKIGRRNHHSDSDSDSSGSDRRNRNASRGGHAQRSSSQNLPNYMKPRSESTGRFRR